MPKENSQEIEVKLIENLNDVADLVYDDLTSDESSEPEEDYSDGEIDYGGPFGALSYDSQDENDREESEDEEATAFEKAAYEEVKAAVANNIAKGKSKATAVNETAENNTVVSEVGITPDHINMVMEFTNCTRTEAIQALRLANDDV